MSFIYVITDADARALGHLRGAKTRRVAIGINRNPVVSTVLRLDDPLTNAILGGKTYCKVYERDPNVGIFAIRFVGRIGALDESGDGGGMPGSVGVTFGGPFTPFAKRLLGKTPTGYEDGTPLAPKDKSELLAGLVLAANAEGYTGVDLGTVSNVGVADYLKYTPFKKASDAIGEVVNTIDGPDFELVMQEPQVVAGGIKIANMNVLPVVGQARPAAVWEYATGRHNVSDYKRVVSYDLANRVYGLPPASNPTGAVVMAEDTESISAFDLQEELVGTDLEVEQFRQSVVDEHVRIRKQPQQTITFTPARDDPSKPGRVPRYGIDFFLGDSVPFRAVDPVTRQVRVNAMLRVYAVDWEIDDAGVLSPKLTLTGD